MTKRSERRLRIKENRQRRRFRLFALEMARRHEGRSSSPQRYSRDGWPMPLREYFAKQMDRRYCLVDFTYGRGWRVSTIWLGMVVSWRNGKPLIFESLVTGGAHDGLQLRYTSEAAARKGHALLVHECEGAARGVLRRESQKLRVVMAEQDPSSCAP